MPPLHFPITPLVKSTLELVFGNMSTMLTYGRVYLSVLTAAALLGAGLDVILGMSSASHSGPVASDYIVMFANLCVTPLFTVIWHRYLLLGEENAQADAPTKGRFFLTYLKVIGLTLAVLALFASAVVFVLYTLSSVYENTLFVFLIGTPFCLWILLLSTGLLMRFSFSMPAAAIHDDLTLMQSFSLGVGITHKLGLYNALVILPVVLCGLLALAAFWVVATWIFSALSGLGMSEIGVYLLTHLVFAPLSALLNLVCATIAATYVSLAYRVVRSRLEHEAA